MRRTSEKNEKLSWINYENDENSFLLRSHRAFVVSDYSDGNGNVSGGESEGENENRKEHVNNSQDNEIPLQTHHEHRGEIEKSTTEATTQPTSSSNITLPCALDRGGCDHECQMVKYDYDPEPIIQCSCYTGFTLDEHDGRRCHGEDFFDLSSVAKQFTFN